MGKPTGFLEIGRRMPDRRDARERLDDWREVYLSREESARREQAGRCMDCGVPFCQQGCPLGNRIPDWNDSAARGNWQLAHAQLAATNNFPEFTGRLCPAPCEAACTLTINDQAVTIEQIELEIIERAFDSGWVESRVAESSGRSVAVVGSGPAGLAAAATLAEVGHAVTVFEADDRIGGLLRYGIPDFKMEKHVLDRRLALMRAAGIVFRSGVRIGNGVSWSELRSENDGVLIAIGSQTPRDLDVPGRELGGVVFAMDYLVRQNRIGAGDETATGPDASGKNVIILGGGDTGSDCLGTAHRQGAKSVMQVELLPEPPAKRADRNPWPQWPVVFRTSSSQEEGGERTFAFRTTELRGGSGVVTHLVGEPLDSGETLVFEADLVILAMGFVAPRASTVASELGVALDSRGNIVVDERFASSVPGVYCAGDAQRGQSLIVWAISDGREAARHLDAHIMGSAPRLPTRGVNQPWLG